MKKVKIINKIKWFVKNKLLDEEEKNGAGKSYCFLSDGRMRKLNRSELSFSESSNETLL